MLEEEEQLSGMSKISLLDGETSAFEINYKLIDFKSEKQLNSFFIVVEFNSESPDQLTTTINSANFNKGNYPNEARHRFI